MKQSKVTKRKRKRSPRYRGLFCASAKKKAHQGGDGALPFYSKEIYSINDFILWDISAGGSSDREIGKLYSLVGAVKRRSTDYIIILQDYQLYHSRFENFFHIFPPEILVEFTLETACLICICKVESGNAVFISATGKLACLIVFILL